MIRRDGIGVGNGSQRNLAHRAVNAREGQGVYGKVGASTNTSPQIAICGLQGSSAVFRGLRFGRSRWGALTHCAQKNGRDVTCSRSRHRPSPLVEALPSEALYAKTPEEEGPEISSGRSSPLVSQQRTSSTMRDLYDARPRRRGEATTGAHLRRGCHFARSLY